MKSSYKALAAYIEPVNQLNDGMEVKELLGISNQKFFQNSHTNTIDIDLQTYRIVRTNQFAYNRATTRNGDKISIALRQGNDCIVSPSYRIFRSKDENALNSEYLMMWFRRPEFDRYARFKSHGSAHEFFEYDQMCQVKLPIPHITKQKEIVKEYNVIQNRIALNQQLIQKLEETAQAIYRAWFVEGIDLENLPEGWKYEKLKNLCEKIGSGSTPTGGKESYFTSGISLIRSTNVYDYNFSLEDLAFISNEQADKLKNVEVKENDILFNITGVSVARCCMVPQNVLPARVNQHVMIIRPDSNLNVSFYLLLNLCSTDSKNAMLGISQSGSTREAITKSEIENFEIFLPNEEMRLKFENLMRQIFLFKELKSTENQKLTELKNLLLSKLATIEN
jgi:type I restriction enzyme S subunit